jgi:DNA polymerase-4
MDKFFGVSKYAQELRHILSVKRFTDLRGLSSARFISKMATNEAKPNGFRDPSWKRKRFSMAIGS